MPEQTQTQVQPQTDRSKLTTQTKLELAKKAIKILLENGKVAMDMGELLVRLWDVAGNKNIDEVDLNEIMQLLNSVELINYYIVLPRGMAIDDTFLHVLKVCGDEKMLTKLIAAYMFVKYHADDEDAEGADGELGWLLWKIMESYDIEPDAEQEETSRAGEYFDTDEYFYYKSFGNVILHKTVRCKPNTRECKHIYDMMEL
jgi:hypothetical protein